MVRLAALAVCGAVGLLILARANGSLERRLEGGALALLAPLAIVSLIVLINPKTRGNYSWLKFGCVAVVASLWIDKGLGMVIAGFVPNPLGKVVHYSPTVPELMISLAIYAVGALILTGLYKIALEVRGQLKAN